VVNTMRVLQAKIKSFTIFISDSWCESINSKIIRHEKLSQFHPDIWQVRKFAK